MIAKELNNDFVDVSTFFNSTIKKVVDIAFSFTAIVAIVTALMLFFSTTNVEAFKTLKFFTLGVALIGVMMFCEIFTSQNVYLNFGQNFYLLAKLFLFGLLSLIWMSAFGSLMVLGKYFGIETPVFSLFAVLFFSYLTTLVSVGVARLVSVFTGKVVGAKYKAWVEFALLAVAFVSAIAFTRGDVESVGLVASCVDFIGSGCFEVLQTPQRPNAL